MIKSMKNIVIRAGIFAGMLCVATACASGPQSSRPDIATFAGASAAEKAVIVINTETEIDCDYVGLSFHNTDKKKLPGESYSKHIKRDPEAYFSMQTVFKKKAKVSEPAIAVVSPGTYKLSSGGCNLRGFKPRGLPGLGAFFLSFKVEPGEVVNLGTLVMETVDVKYERSGLVRAAGALTLDFKKNDKNSYVVYEFEDNTSTLSAGLVAPYDDVSQKAVFKAPSPLLGRALLEDAYRNAYAPKEDGSAPSATEARANLREELNKLRVQALRNLLADFSKNKDAATGEAAAETEGEVAGE